jgi:Ca2+/Na+ antiporter
MDSNKANIINSIVLVFIGMWSYLEAPSSLVLIPVVYGVVLLICSNGVKNKNKLIAHIAVLLTLMLLLAYFPFKLLNNDGGIELICVLVMTFTSLLSMIYFIKSFKANRKKSNINI